MKKTLMLSLLMILFLFCLPQACAHVFQLSNDKTVYEPGDTILITLLVKNTLSVEKTFDIHIFLQEKNNCYSPYAKSYSVDLMPNESKTITVYSSNVSEYLVNGDYLLHATLLQDGFALYEDELDFYISGLPEVMEIRILLSNTSSYKPLKEVFIVNQRVYIGYNASVEHVDVHGVLTNPSGGTTNIVLPYDFKTDESGLYSLYIEAEKEGYRLVEDSVQFAVIKHVPFFGEEKETTGAPWIIIGLVLLIIVLAIVVFFYRKKPL